LDKYQQFRGKLFDVELRCNHTLHEQSTRHEGRLKSCQETTNRNETVLIRSGIANRAARVSNFCEHLRSKGRFLVTRPCQQRAQSL
jgi:hypothetical protein